MAAKDILFALTPQSLGGDPVLCRRPRRKPSRNPISKIFLPLAPRIVRISRIFPFMARGDSMNIHEYQAKKLFAQNGLPVPKGQLANSALEAEFAYRRLKSSVCVVKAQVHAGGRGKAGGVKLVRSPEECAKAAEDMLGMRLVTHQTGEEGKIVHSVYVEEVVRSQRNTTLLCLLIGKRQVLP